MTGHKIKTSVQSCKIMIRKKINYIAEPKNLTRNTSFYNIPTQNKYLPVNIINKKEMRAFFK